MNPFSQIVSEYSDKQILKILKSPKDYATILKRACQKEANQRNLDQISKPLIHNDNIMIHVYKVKNIIHNGGTYEQCRQYLLNEDLNEDQMLNIMNKAVEEPKKQIPQPYKNKDYYGEKLGTGLFIIYLVFKLITWVAS